MTELSYTAWDDNKYQWPPPEGWYQASDGKWWPEGYGPVANQTSADASTASADAVDTGDTAAAVADEAPDAFESTESTEFAETESDPVGVEETGSDGGDAIEVKGEPETDGAEFADPVERAAEDSHRFEESEASVEAQAEIDADGASEFTPVAEPGDAVDLDRFASGFAEIDESTHSADPLSDSESRYSTSSAGMAATGFAPRGDGGSSSLGLAGWAQTGSSEIRNRVDVSQEYDYSPADGEPENLLDPIEVDDDESAIETSSFDATADDTAAPDTPDVETAGLDTSTIDGPAEPVDSTLSRLDDLKRQVEQQSFPTNLDAPDATDPFSDPAISGFDPTETLDIDPNDLTLESDPHYGGAGEPDVYGAASGVGTDGPPTADAYNGDYGGPAEPTTEHGYDDRVQPDPDSYGFSPVGEATTDAPPAETRPFGLEGESPAPIGEPPAPMTDSYREPQVDYTSGPVLTPMSSPPPKPGPGRMVLYGIIVLLALAVAGVTGYLLFQLQSDDGDTSTGDGATAAATAAGDAGPSDTSLQGPGAFSDPHDLTGGVRLTVPVGDGDDEVWMLQVREPAVTTDLGDDLVEVTSRLRIRNDSTSGDLSASGLKFVLVSADGSTSTTAAASCSAGDDLNLQTAIEPGNDIEGNVCWTVPAAQASSALLGVESVHAGGRVHVQLS